MSRYKSVLLIDDSDIDNFVNRKIVEKSDFADEIIVKQSGRSAIEYLSDLERSNKDFPDIIFLDIRMPEMNGFEFLDELRNFKETFLKKTNVVMLTSSLDDSDMERAEKIPIVKKFLNKPISRELLSELDI